MITVGFCPEISKSVWGFCLSGVLPCGVWPEWGFALDLFIPWVFL